MAQQMYKVDMRSAKMPLLSYLQTRTIIGAVSGEAPAVEDRPGILYGHNILPTSYGITSVAYREEVEAFYAEGGDAGFSAVFEVYATDGTRIYWALNYRGLSFYLDSAAGEWVSVGWSVAWLDFNFNPASITLAKVNGISYIYNNDPALVDPEDRLIYTLVPDGLGGYDLTAVVTTGLDMTDIIGVSSANGYLLAYTTQALAWSSTLDPTDFVPSAVTGAGGGKLAEISGRVNSIHPHPAGMIIYTEDNMVMGTITGNPNYPFRFKEIPDSKGALDASSVAYEANSLEHFAYTNAGLTSVTPNAAEVILPEVTDFLGGEVVEEYVGLGEFDRTELTSSLFKRLTYVSGRYLVISYGSTYTTEDDRIPKYTYALVIDTALRRLGKLKVTHIDVIELTLDQQESSKHSIAFITYSGQLVVADTSGRIPSEDSVLLLGKFQLVRTHGITIQGVEVENITSSETDFTCLVLSSLDGKNADFIASPVLAYSSANYRKYGCRTTGKNHVLELTGTFHITTAQINYVNAGRR